MYSSKAVLTAARPAAGAAAVAAAVTAALARLLHIRGLILAGDAPLEGLPAMEAAGSGLQAAAWASMIVCTSGRARQLFKVA